MAEGRDPGDPPTRPPAVRTGPSDRGSAALVTGASGGLGARMARELAARGIPLVLTARSEGALRSLAAELAAAHDIDVRVVPMDLSAPGAGHELADRVLAGGTSVGYLVNNAGFGQWGPYPELDAHDEMGMVRLNMEAVTALTRSLLPDMLARGYGRILNVASTAAFLPGPGMAVYYATKAYVLSYSEALAEELRDTGVTVTCLCPGPTPTDFQERSGMSVASGPMRWAVVAPDRVARSGIVGMCAGRRLVVPGLVNRLTTLLPRFLPRSWVPKLVKRVQDGRTPNGH